MRAACPAILAAHPLHYLWGFKYDSSLSGIALHADKAAVNVNLWITPDASNRDPDHGGLVLWDSAAPRDWKFQRYNGDTEASRAFLRDTGAHTKNWLKDQINESIAFAHAEGIDRDEIRNWAWKG